MTKKDSKKDSKKANVKVSRAKLAGTSGMFVFQSAAWAMSPSTATFEEIKKDADSAPSIKLPSPPDTKDSTDWILSE